MERLSRTSAQNSDRKLSEGDLLKATHKLQKQYAESRRDLR